MSVIAVRLPPPGGVGSGLPGVTVDSPFNVTGSSFAHGSTLTVLMTAGSFPARNFGTAPWVYDTVDKQYVNGINQNLYAAFSDATDIGTSLWTQNSSNQTAGVDVMRWYTSQAKRTTYQNAVYATLNMQHGKGCIGNPPWPAAWGAQNNKIFFLSFWAMCSAPFQGTGGGDQSTKAARIIGNPLGATATLNFIASGDSGWTSNSVPAGAADFKSTRSGGGGQWTRFDTYWDTTTGSIYSTAGGIVNTWWGIQGAGTPFHLCSNSSYVPAVGAHQFEICHPVDQMYVSPTLASNVWLDDTTPHNLPNITTSIFGYDDGHGLSVGTNYSISEVYYDTDLWRFELSDSLTWDTSPTSTMNREIQGRWNRDGNTQCTVELNFGQFAPGKTGLALWLVNTTDRQSAIRVCHN